VLDVSVTKEFISNHKLLILRFKVLGLSQKKGKFRYKIANFMNFMHQEMLLLHSRAIGDQCVAGYQSLPQLFRTSNIV
jgi:hypothetical protein